MTEYKIKRRTDGLYSTGGRWPRFTNRGKIWKKGPLHSHLSLVERAGHKSAYADCDIIELEILENSATDIDTYCALNRKI